HKQFPMLNQAILLKGLRVSINKTNNCMEQQHSTPPPPPTTSTTQRKGINVVDRAKNILITPKSEWSVIEKEQFGNAVILTSYVIPILLIGAVATFIGQGLIGINTGFGS